MIQGTCSFRMAFRAMGAAPRADGTVQYETVFLMQRSEPGTPETQVHWQTYGPPGLEQPLRAALSGASSVPCGGMHSDRGSCPSNLSLERPPPLDRFGCAADADCTTSCNHGAVNRAWYALEGSTRTDCEDGCASDGVSARCVRGSCAAFREGLPHGACSRRQE